MWTFTLTLLFANGLHDMPRQEFATSALCHAAEKQAVQEAQIRIDKGILKGYTLVTCHPATAEEKTP